MSKSRKVSLLLVLLLYIYGITAYAGTSEERGLVAAIEVSGNGRVMAVDYFGGETVYPIDFIDTTTQKLLGSVDQMQLGFSSFTLDHEGNRLIGTGYSGELAIYDRRNESVTVLREGGQFGSLGRIRWNPTDESVIAYIWGGLVEFLDINTRKSIGAVNSSMGRVSDFAFHPSGNAIVTSVYVPADTWFPSVIGMEIWNQLPQLGDVLHTPSITLEGRGAGPSAGAQMVTASQ